jgi:hypothetical protein
LADRALVYSLAAGNRYFRLPLSRSTDRNQQIEIPESAVGFSAALFWPLDAVATALLGIR